VSSRETFSVRENMLRAQRLRSPKSAGDIARKQQIHQRRQKALELRVAGASLQDIVNVGIGYNNVQNVSHDLKKVYEQFMVHQPEDLILLDLARLDLMQKICTTALMQGNTAEVRNLLAIMDYRRKSLGITEESILERKLETTNLVNNGIMVVQGTQGDYLQGIMQAAGASPEEIRQELERVSSSNRSPEVRKSPEVIPGEVIHGETGAHARGDKKTPGKLLKKPKRGAHEPGRQTKATGATPTRSNGRGGTGRPEDVPRGSEGPLVTVEDQVEAIARALDERIEAEPGIGRLSDPAITGVDLAALERGLHEGDPPESTGANRRSSRGVPVKVLRVPVKTPDMNQPVSPGVVYRNPPRKGDHAGSYSQAPPDMVPMGRIVEQIYEE
jgi:hypothetical protein